MTGTPRELQCPECGAWDWHIPRPGWGWMGAEWVNLVVAAVPAVFLLIMHLWWILTRLVTGSWPESVGASGHATAIALMATPLFGLVNIAIVLLLIGVALFHRRHWKSAARAMLIAVVLWVMTIVTIVQDPLGLFDWINV